ncbi:DNA helicase PIF1, ATP-dependent [Corchorus olitorius]|uniref:ATP-dependent DNA helicase n=1 Tax=Corchorus olitorius TaxID=93759 RepID=A0A1R3JNV2_9ROSI|nr:DNA helicase PIF1, ATP-dependent [Corchorus olitorius]
MQGGVFFVYSHGGTGKTYLWITLISGIRSTGRIVLVMASSGIASLLLPNGRTAHSMFMKPLHIDDTSTCSILKRTELAALMEAASLIIWNEAPMINRNCFEALDKTLKDLLSDVSEDASKKPFGEEIVEHNAVNKALRHDVKVTSVLDFESCFEIKHGAGAHGFHG